uniref:Uncharacterized protein n=1 Tax=Takifugu rubripes TaxID=31033 RepID=A0A3B5K217_TAKRU
ICEPCFIHICYLATGGSVSESQGSRFRPPSPTTLAHPLGIGPLSRQRGVSRGRRQTFREEKIQKQTLIAQDGTRSVFCDRRNLGGAFQRAAF